MAETFLVPLTGDSVVNQGDVSAGIQQPVRESGFINNQYVPPAERVSLHKTRLGAAMAQAEAKAKAATPAPQPSQVDVLSQQMATLTTAVSALAASQVRGMSQPQEQGAGELQNLIQHNRYSSGEPYTGQQYDLAPDQPDPLNHDFFDPDSAADFHHLNSGYIEREVHRRIDAQREAQQKVSENERLQGQFHAAEAKFKRDSNYQEIMRAAIDRFADSGFKLPLEEAYLQISNETEARNGRRGSSYLPKDVKTLGDIMRYRQQTGRSGR
jgi:hypothetical protein